jgi:SAM-dependent methyltransferase
MDQNADVSLSQTSGVHSFDTVLFSYLVKIEDQHFWFRTRNHVIRALIRQLVKDFPPGYRVLEIGCGTGNVLREISIACPHGLVVGTDLYLDGLKFAKKRVDIPLVQADLHALPFESKFNLVGLFDVIEHIPNDEEVLQHLNCMIGSGGYLFLTVPAHPALWSYFDEGSHHCRRYRQSELETKLRLAGFEIEFITPYMAIIFPLVWLARKFTSLVKGRESVTIEDATTLTLAEFTVTPVVNPILTWLLSFETQILARRRKLPFGTSLLVLAQKLAN